MGGGRRKIVASINSRLSTRDPLSTKAGKVIEERKVQYQERKVIERRSLFPVSASDCRRISDYAMAYAMGTSSSCNLNLAIHRGAVTLVS